MREIRHKCQDYDHHERHVRSVLYDPAHRRVPRSVEDFEEIDYYARQEMEDCEAVSHE
jgi:hypothetical protein